jgi:hypothetical protein
LNLIWDQKVGGSNPLAPAIFRQISLYSLAGLSPPDKPLIASRANQLPFAGRRPIHTPNPLAPWRNFTASRTLGSLRVGVLRQRDLV